MQKHQNEVYQIRIWLRYISPGIWRRLLIRSDSTIADLHHTIQIALGWTDTHLHQFVIHGKEYGVQQPGGIWFSDNPDQVRLNRVNFRLKLMIARIVVIVDAGQLAKRT